MSDTLYTAKFMKLNKLHCVIWMSDTLYTAKFKFRKIKSLFGSLGNFYSLINNPNVRKNKHIKKEQQGLSPGANYTDWATAACQRS
jgi:hypothetical protein